MQKNRIPRPPKQLHPALVALIDVLLIAACLSLFALFDHVLPRSERKAVYTGPAALPSPQSAATAAPEENARQPELPIGIPEDAGQPELPTSAPEVDARPEEPDGGQIEAFIPPEGDFSVKFAGKFTDGEVIQTDTSYQSANLNITLTKNKVYYGSHREVYFVEDIYIRSIECLRTVFAQDTYGKAISEGVVSMSRRTSAVAAINSDYYGYGNAGIVIRNGVLYRSEFEPGEEVLVIYRNGDMKVYREGELDVEQAMADGAWQSFSFGPSFLDENGDLRAEGYAEDIHNPRTIIGMIEPGHYLFIVIDGRQSGYSDGMTYPGCANLCKELGCAVAYNLDGGRTSQMTFRGALVNHPYREGRATSDLICIADVDA